MAHLLECSRRRRERTLPLRFHAAVAGFHLEAEARPANCPVQPHVRHWDTTTAGHDFDLYCDRHWTKRWRKKPAAAKAHALVSVFVDQVLAAGASSRKSCWIRWRPFRCPRRGRLVGAWGKFPHLQLGGQAR